VTRKVPLEALGKVRDAAVDRAASEMADAVRERERKTREAADAERARVEAESRATAVRAAEALAIERGELRATDLARAYAWESRATEELEALGRAEGDAHDALSTARSDEERAREALAAREADARVVERYQDRWKANEKRALDVREEEAVGEAWRPKRD
jgi:hypothetical protein